MMREVSPGAGVAIVPSNTPSGWATTTVIGEWAERPGHGGGGDELCPRCGLKTAGEEEPRKRGEPEKEKAGLGGGRDIRLRYLLFRDGTLKPRARGKKGTHSRVSSKAKVPIAATGHSHSHIERDSDRRGRSHGANGDHSHDNGGLRETH